MAAGLHWEWRGFGQENSEVSQRIQALPKAFSKPAKFIDKYLWIPDCSINVKLRQGVQSGLKFKRFHSSQGLIELWEERPDELYSLPLSDNIVSKIGQELGIQFLSDIPSEIGSEEALIELLNSTQPKVQLITVEKLRVAHIHKVEIDGQVIKVIVELAQITQPEEILSIGVEETSHLSSDSSAREMDVARRAVQKTLDDLQLPADFDSVSYLTQLGRWV